jgi:hypothetical protein
MNRPEKSLGQIAKDAFDQEVTEAMFLHESGLPQFDCIAAAVEAAVLQRQAAQLPFQDIKFLANELTMLAGKLMDAKKVATAVNCLNLSKKLHATRL